MSLRITLTEASASAQLNRWAAEMEARIKQHEKQHSEMNQYVTKLHELNPGLTRPNLKK